MIGRSGRRPEPMRNCLALALEQAGLPQAADVDYA
jgi:hypothetical protein